MIDLYYLHQQEAAMVTDHQFRGLMKLSQTEKLASTGMLQPTLTSVSHSNAGDQMRAPNTECKKVADCATRPCSSLGG